MTVRRIIAAAAAFLLACSLYADNDMVRVRKAVGRWEVSGDISVVEAEERALMEAKKEALRKAGIMETVWSVMGQVSTSNGDKFSEAYSNVSTLAINGLVNILDKKVEEVWDPNMKRMFKVVTIDANVIKTDVEEDPTYKLEVEGIDPVYKEGDLFECSFKVHGSNSHVKIFWFTNDEADLIYPNDFEGDQVFTARTRYHVPVTDEIELVMAKNHPETDVEFINIIILATKKNYPYVGHMDFQSILSWIYGIPADQRTLYHNSTVIK